MKSLTKIVLASALTLAIAAPASAAYLEQDQQTQISTTHARANDATGHHAMARHVRGQTAPDSMVSEPASEPAGMQIDPDYRYFHDLGIGSQS